MPRCIVAAVVLFAVIDTGLFAASRTGKMRRWYHYMPFGGFIALSEKIQELEKP